MNKRLPLGIAIATTLVIALVAFVTVPGIIKSSSDGEADFEKGISIAYARDVQPFHFTDSNGNPAGIMIDIWTLWSEKTGIPIAFQEASWDESLQMVGNGEADVHAGLFYSGERDEFLDYGTSFVDTETHVFRHKSLPQVNDSRELSAYRVGVLKGDFVESYLRDSLSEENLVPFKSYDEMIEALKEGVLKVFAADTPTGLYILKQNGLLSDFLYESEKPLYREKWYAAAGEGKDDLLVKMNEGFDQISEEEKLAIERKWIGAERSGTDTLIIGIGRSFEPLAFINSLGQPSGLFVDLWREWSRITGRPVEFRGSSWTETLEGLKSGAIDIHSGLSYTEERAELYGFTNQIYKTHTRVYHRPDEEQPENLEGYRDFVVGIQYGTYMDGEFRKAFPLIRVKNYSTGQDLIKALLEGEVKAAVHEAHLMEGQLDRLGLAGRAEARKEILFPSSIHGAVRKGSSLLLREINEGFESLSPERLAELENRWITDPARRFFSGLSDQSVSGRISLTEEEKAFLDKHPVITLGGPDVPPLDFVDENGKAAGIGPAYMELVAELLGIRFEYMTETWPVVHEMARNKEIDGIRILVKSEERKEYLNFTVPYTPFEYAIIIPNDAPTVDSLEGLSGKSLAVLEASVDQVFVKEKYPDIRLLAYDTYEKGLRAVFNGEADAFLGALASASYQIQEKMLFGLKVSATVEELSSDLYMAVRKDWPELIPILNKALDSISSEEHRKIKSKWFALTQDGDSEIGVSLTSEERDFLRNNPVIRVHNEMDWPPYNYNEGGIAKGYSIDYINLAAEKAGLDVEFISGPSWDEFMTMAENREIDVMLNIARNDRREQFLDFTAPYMTVSRRIVHRENNGPFVKISDLNGRKTALVEGFFTTTYLEQNFPEIEQVLFKTTSEALLAVARREADAYIGEYGVTLYLIDKNRLSDLIISPPLPGEDLPANDLHFGVRKDWDILTGILNKALAEISLQERSQLQDEWFPPEDFQVRESRESSLMSIVIQISIIILVLLVMLFGIYFLTRQILGKYEGSADFFSTEKIRSYGFVLLFTLFTIILAMAYFGLDRIKNRSISEFRKYMISVLENAENSVNIWIDHNLSQLEIFSRDPEFLKMVERQLAENRTSESLLISDGLRDLRDFFSDKRVEFENEGFFIISPDRVNIASKRDENLGLINLIEEQRPDLLADVFRGQSRFIPPLRSDVHIDGEGPELPPTMFYAVPLFDEQGDVMAALTLRDIPMNEFSSFCELGRIGDSGETYAFDDQGILLSMSRFEEQLRDMGLLQAGQRSLLNVTITEPDGLRPFTYMMESAARRIDGENFKGYRDYRGIEVFGVWTWNSRHGFGLTTEIDVEEALISYNTIRFILIAILLVTLFLAIGATVLSIVVGQKANSALSGANDELEGRVELRTAELKKSEERSQSLLEAAPDGMVIVDEKHVIVQVNNQTENMFGYSRDELIGQEIEILVPEMKRAEHVGRRESYIADPSTRAMGAVMEILAQRKDGSLFPADIGLSPIKTEEGLLVVSSVRDITERKRAEEDLRKLSTAVEQNPASLVITDFDGNIEYVNPRFQQVTGYSSEEVLGKNPRILNARVQPDNLYKKMWKTISSGNLWEGEFCNLRKNGEKYWESASIAPIKNNSGEITHYVAIKEDITEQKKAREELTLLNQLVFGSLEAADIGAWWVDFNEEDTFHALDTTANLIAMPVNEDKTYKISAWGEILVKTGELDPEYKKMIDNTFEQFTGAVSGKYESYRATYPVLQTDGSIKWIIARADVPERKEDGSALLMTGTLIDITELKKSEDEIKHINFMSDNALDLTRAGFWKIDYSNPEYYYSSPRAADIFGEPHNEEYIYHLTDEWLSRIIEADPASAKATGKNYSDAVEGLIPRYDATYPYKRPKDGKIVWIRAIGDVIRDDKGKALLMYGVAQDITEVHDAENEIRMQHDQLLKIIEELPIPAAHWKLDGTILHLNKVLTELLGYTIDDVPTVDIHFEKFYPDPAERVEYKKVWRQFLEEAAETGTAVKPLMLNATAKTGEVKNLLTHTIQIGDRALTLWVDFTERENYEKALEKAKIVAEDATKAKSDFLANMSHEIRTPMNAIIGLSHLIQKTELSRKQDDYIQKISGSAHNLLGIINDILDFSKIEAGKLTMESIDFNLNEVFDNLGSMMGNKTRDKGLELIFDIATDIPPNLVGDPLRLGQILLNLTNNAVKFTDKGEIVVSVEIEEKDPEEVMLKFKVRDTGIGLTEEQAGNLFQAFTQADTSTTRQFGGTGLGLSISKKLSEMMGGSIGVESVHGGGSTFYFTGLFQYRKAKKLEVLPEEIRNLNVLIVDDNATSREVLTAYAGDFSFSSVAVENGQEAIKTIRETKENRRDPFDLILMDYMMPGLNGYETATKINEILIERERPRYILVTSYSRDEILDAVDDAGFSGFILKPINQSIMFNTIVEAFGLASESGKKKKGEKFPEGFDLVRGAAVLLAEDNEINQQVAREVLEGEGFYVDIARNGREAVDMNSRKDYDIILMDLQMPVLDGYGATEEIRKDDTYKDLSIVAMTADAMTGVRDNVLEVGMNDYITKPIDTSQLWKALVQWIKPGERALPEGFESQIKPEEDDSPIHPVPGVDVDSGLMRIGGRKKLYIDLLGKFVDDFTDFESSIVDLLSDGKSEEAGRLAHTLKGVGANLGAESLADKAALLELAIKDNLEIETRLETVNAQLQSVIANIVSSGNLDQKKESALREASLSDRELRELLAEARDSLKKRKPKPALEIFDRLEAVRLPDDTAGQLKECRILLGRYKMKEAVDILNELTGAENE